MDETRALEFNAHIHFLFYKNRLVNVNEEVGARNGEIKI